LTERSRIDRPAGDDDDIGRLCSLASTNPGWPTLSLTVRFSSRLNVGSRVDLDVHSLGRRFASSFEINATSAI
jgi:hypothetical protein